MLFFSDYNTVNMGALDASKTAKFVKKLEANLLNKKFVRRFEIEKIKKMYFSKKVKFWLNLKLLNNLSNLLNFFP